MPSTYEPIATATVAVATGSITFSSIPATYTDLRLVLTLSSTSGATSRFRFNGDTAANYSQTILQGDGTTAGTGRFTSNTFSYISNTTTSITSPFFAALDIFSYAGSTFKTTLNSLSNDNNGSGSVEQYVSLWRSTSAITSIEVYRSSTLFSIGSTATLYGIKNA
jgi:hypothetical protein